MKIIVAYPKIIYIRLELSAM